MIRSTIQVVQAWLDKHYPDSFEAKPTGHDDAWLVVSRHEDTSTKRMKIVKSELDEYMHKRSIRQKKIDNDFQYHSPKGDQAARYEKLRNKAKEFALLIVDLTPESPEQEQALQLLNLATMSANASIARHE